MQKSFMTLLFIAFYAISMDCYGNEEKKQTDILSGHSYHGEAFNEGPRQRPYLMPELGQSQFKISTENVQAQNFFNQGIDQLHGFWYFEAERSFRQVATLDPDCAMAYWGLAMANVNNKDRAKKFIQTAREKVADTDINTSQREILYIEALEAFYDEKQKEEKERARKFTKKLEELVLKFPGDIEAKAFLACQVWMNQRKGLKINSYIGINSILDDIFEANPDHPAHHYRIHLWDYEKAEVALQSAAQCGPSLPGIAHMWHMPGHIYSRLKRYEDAVWQQEASARVDHKHMMNDWVLPDQIHNFAHNNEWCIRNLIHVGRVSDAIALAKNMISLPRHPKYNVLDKNGSGKYGRQRLFQVLSTYEQWQSLIDACESGLLEETDLPNEKINRLRLMGRAYFRSGQTEKGIEILEILQSHLDSTKIEKQEAREKERSEARERQGQLRTAHKLVLKFIPQSFRESYSRSFSNALRREQRQKTQSKLEKLIKPIDDRINVINRAIDEMTGYQLVHEEKFAEALSKLKKAGEVDAVYRAYIQHLSGKTEKAIEAARKHVKNKKNEVQPLSMLAWLLWECNQRDEAAEVFRELQPISSSIDLTSAFFDRLKPIAEHAGFGKDWRCKKEFAEDLGNRPELDSLGPFRWQPISAPSWQLPDSIGQVVSSSDFAGQPVIIIFYLGHGCLHCAEQLQAFAPMTAEFQKEGIQIVAISTDDQNGLKKSLDSYGEVPLPIQLVANPDLDVFRIFRTYDEFEHQPLHGTFLVDSDGCIRWQDISYEPFMDPKFLLSESKRLLLQTTEN